MKRLTLTLSVLFMAVVAIFAQMQSFKYQAVARDAVGHIMENQDIGVKVSILFDNASGTVVYSEAHDITTNQFGLVDLEIGDGDVVLSGVFSAIDWSAGDYFVKIEVDLDGGTDYSLLGTTQLLAVPFAKYAERA